MSSPEESSVNSFDFSLLIERVLLYEQPVYTTPPDLASGNTMLGA